MELLLAYYLLVYIIYFVCFSSSGTFCFPVLISSTTVYTCFALSLSLSIAPNFYLDAVFTSLGGSLGSGFFNSLFRFLVVAVTILVVYLCRENLAKQKVYKVEYDIIVVFSLLGLCLLNSCSDFIMFYLAIELQSLSFYLLATFQRKSEYNVEAGIKYFVLGAFSSGLLLFGFSLVFLASGSVSFEGIEKIIADSNSSIVSLGAAFVFITFLFKLGAFPCHLWLCDVYEGSMLTVTMFFSSVPKIVLFGVLLNLCQIFYGFLTFNKALLLFSGLGSICFASVVALYQKRLKRLLAYSAVSHSGFIILGIICLSNDSVRSVLVYILLYTLMTLSIFSLLLLVGFNSSFPKFLINWLSLAKRNLTIAFSFTFLLLSTAGIPPLAGFYSKLCILLSLLSQSMVWAVTLIVIFSSIACFYYIRLVKIFFFTTSARNAFWLGSGTKSVEFFTSLSLLFIVFFLLSPDFLIELLTLASISIL